jgi:hypothetical protein
LGNKTETFLRVFKKAVIILVNEQTSYVNRSVVTSKVHLTLSTNKSLTFYEYVSKDFLVKEIIGRQTGTVHRVIRTLPAVQLSRITSPIDNIGSLVISTALDPLNKHLAGKMQQTPT